MVLTARARGAVVGRHRIQALHDGARAGVGIAQERGQPGDLEAAADGAVLVQVPEEDLGLVGAGGGVELERGELDRLVGVDRARGGVADHQLDGDRDRRDREREQEAQPVVAVAPAAQHADRVGRGDEEPGGHQGGEVHVRELVLDGVVEDHRPDVDVGDRPRRVHGEAAGLVHPRVGRHDHQGAQQADDRDGHAGPEVRPRAQAPPAEDVDRDEDRLEEEEDALEGEGQPDHVAEAIEEARPQEAHLEAEDRPGDGPHREADGRHLRPALGQAQVVGVVAAQPEVVGDQQDQAGRRSPAAPG